MKANDFEARQTKSVGIDGPQKRVKAKKKKKNE